MRTAEGEGGCKEGRRALATPAPCSAALPSASPWAGGLLPSKRPKTIALRAFTESCATSVEWASMRSHPSSSLSSVHTLRVMATEYFGEAHPSSTF